MKKLCYFIGVAWQPQLVKIQEHPVLKSVVTQTVVTAADGKNYNTTCIPLSMLPFWLAIFELKRIKDSKVYDTLVLFQKECAKVLRNHFFGKTSQTPNHPPRQDMWSPPYSNAKEVETYHKHLTEADLPRVFKFYSEKIKNLISAGFNELTPEFSEKLKVSLIPLIEDGKLDYKSKLNKVVDHVEEKLLVVDSNFEQFDSIVSNLKKRLSNSSLSNNSLAIKLKAQKAETRKLKTTVTILETQLDSTTRLAKALESNNELLKTVVSGLTKTVKGIKAQLPKPIKSNPKAKGANVIDMVGQVSSKNKKKDLDPKPL